ncbi:hypothetical protein CFOL_v3_06595, partial [Cephalotus follicularis]
ALGFDSDYNNSSDPGSHTEYSDGSENSDGNPKELKRKPCKFSYYSSNREFELGMRFESGEQFRKLVNDYCVEKSVCLRLYASVDNSIKTLQIKTLKGEHNYHVVFENKRVNSKYLVSFFKDKIRAIPKIKKR